MKSELVEELNREARAEERVEAGQKHLISLVTRKFGKSDFVTAEINAIENSERLERMIESIFDVNTTAELLAIQ